MTSLTRGLKNNNPLNIRKSTSKWQGKIEGTDADFETFSSPQFGLRAAARLLLNYQNEGLLSIKAMIGTWAPSIENPTVAYWNNVATYCGVDPDANYEVDNSVNMKKMLKAMLMQENGKQYEKFYKDEVYDQAMRMAGVHDVAKPKVLATPEGQAIATVGTLTTLTATSQFIQAVTPTFDLVGELIKASPWIASAIGVGVIVLIGLKLLKKYKQTGGL